MRWLGETINVMSMGGLAVAIGLVIDDAVVVVENIYRHLDAGEPPAQAVQLAMRELIAPVVGSTLTTVVVFVPLGMLSGVVGQFFRALSITLAAAVLISLVQALTLIPLLARLAARRRETRRQCRCITRGRTAGAGLLTRTLDATMRRPVVGIVLARSCSRPPACCCSRARHRLPAGGGRGRLRHRLPDAGRAARSRRPTASSQDGGRAAADAGHRRVHAPHGIRARPVRDAAEQAATSSSGSSRAASAVPPKRSSTTCATSWRKRRRSSRSSSSSCCRT